MKNIKRISRRLWQLVIGLTALIIQLSRQMVFPNRKRKGNLLNILFLFYIGVIACIQHFEHNRFKMADLFRSRLVRRGLMLGSFFLFFLTSYEQPVIVQTSLNESATVEYTYQSLATKLSCSDTKDFPAEFHLAQSCLSNFSLYTRIGHLPNGSDRYLQVRHLFI